MFRKYLTLFALVFVLASCGGPSDEVVKQDAIDYLTRELGRNVSVEVTGVLQGEGWADALEKHIAFNLVVQADVKLKAPVTAKILLSPGQRLQGGELQINYQKWSDGTWHAVYYGIVRFSR